MRRLPSRVSARSAAGSRNGRTVRRGSSTVEFMLFLGAMMPVILYSLYITDALYDMLKAQEAAGAAVWEATGALLHDYQGYNHSGKVSAALNASAAGSMTRYKGLDEWDPSNPTSRQTPATRGALTQLNCQPANGLSEPIQSVAASAMPRGLDGNLHTGGFVQCQSELQVTNVYFGGKPLEHYLDGPVGSGSKWWSTVPLYTKRMLSPLTFCGVGAPNGGACPANQGVTLLADDWGLAEDSTGTGNDQSSAYPDQSTDNPHFRKLADSTFEDLKVNTLALTWDSFDNTLDPALGPVGGRDPQYNKFFLSYEREPASGQTGPILSSSSPSAKAEASYNQTAETFPMKHSKIAPQANLYETFRADQGQGSSTCAPNPGASCPAVAARKNDYLGL